MTTPPAVHRDEEAGAERRYRDISRDPRYGHYARIPERVCRCLDYFGLAFDRAEVAERLRTYYIFIGVADDAIDAGSVRAGADILRQLTAPAFDLVPAFEFGKGARPSSVAPVELATDALRRHVGARPHPALRERLGELYGAVVSERESETMTAYVAARKAVGQLTAEVSYLLIVPLLRDGGDGGGCEEVRRFLWKVGEVGCLLDSVIDLRSDERLGLLGFSPTRRDRLRLAARTLVEGGGVLLGHPRLVRLFLEAAGDDLLDRLRARASPPAKDSFGEVKAGARVGARSEASA